MQIQLSTSTPSSSKPSSMHAESDFVNKMDEAQSMHTPGTLFWLPTECKNAFQIHQQC